MEKEFLIFLLAVPVAGMVAQWVGWRLGIPAIVLLLGIGLLLGPGVGILQPAQLFGPLLQPMVGAAVAVIVFEGGLTLNLRDLRAAGGGVARLVGIALPLNLVLSATAVRWMGGLSWAISVQIAAILVVTGPTVILPLLRQARLQPKAAALLKWEAVVNDPIGAVLAVVVFEYLLAISASGQQEAVGFIGGRLAVGIAVAIALAVGTAYAVRAAFHSDLVPEVMKTPVMLAAAVGLYALANLVQKEIGLLSATVLGMVLANIGITGIRPLSRTKEALSMMLVGSLFIVLAADLKAETFTDLSWNVPAAVAALLLARPVAIALATIGSDLAWRERLLVAWSGPRGIVAAAIGGIAGGRLAEAGYADGGLVLPVVFLTIVATVLLQGLPLAPLARHLRLRTTERPGLLVVGVSPWNLRLAEVLGSLDVPVIMADRSWNALRPARERGIETSNVEVLSEWVDEVLDSAPFDHALAATDDDAYNSLVCARLAPELGREHVHQLALRSGRLDARHVPAPEWRGKVVAEKEFDHDAVNRMLAEGWDFAVQRIEEGEEGALRGSPDARAKPIIVVRGADELLFNTPERKVRLQAGDAVVTFAPGGHARELRRSMAE